MSITKVECQECGVWSEEDTLCSICENAYCYRCCEDVVEEIAKEVGL